MKLHRGIVGDINCHIQTILVESVKLEHVIHDLKVGEYQHFGNSPPSFLKFTYNLERRNTRILRKPFRNAHLRPSACRIARSRRSRISQSTDYARFFLNTIVSHGLDSFFRLRALCRRTASATVKSKRSVNIKDAIQSCD